NVIVTEQGEATPPVASLSPTEVDMTVGVDQTASATLTLSNLAASGADNLEYNVDVVASSPTARDVATLGARTAEAIAQDRRAAQQRREAQRLAWRQQGAQYDAAEYVHDLLSEVGPAASAGTQTVTYAGRGGIDC